MKSVSFICQEGGSNKEYHIQMIPKDDKFVINFQYGAIGQTLKPGTKTPAPLDLDKAEKLFDSLIKERLRKGYTQTHKSYPDGGKAPDFSAEVITEKKTRGIFPQLLNTILEDEVMKYINDDDYVAQEKKDGQRRMVDRKDKDVVGLNKKGQEVNLQDVIIKSILNELTHARSFVLDGEIIGDKLFLFDILSLNGDDKMKQPLLGRLNLLESMKFKGNVEVVKTAYTREDKLKMYNDLKAANAEGIVFKKKNSLYTAGRPSSGGSQLKNKFYKEASFIVKNITEGKRSIGLELIDDKGNRVFMGKCTVPPNKDIPEVGDVVEVRYLYAYLGGAIFQPVYKEKRNDVDPDECLMTQIIYKAGQESDEEE